ncbi:MAG: GGDEF domain-containing protein [Lachnospiraceae bacterium]|nr:GGDEF domain-containing protein [Lachnospiraceae bacterium]
MDQYIIAADIVSTAFIIVLLLATILFSNKKDYLSKVYIRTLIIQIIGATADATAYMLVGRKSLMTLCLIFSVVSFNSCVFLMLSFSEYMYLVIKEKIIYIRFKKSPILIMAVIDILIQIIGTINGKFMRVEGESIVLGEWQAFAFIIPLVFLIVFYFVLIRYRKKLGKKNFLALGSYMTCPFIVIVGELFIFDMDLTYVATALSLFIIYVFIQAGMIEKYNIREQQLTEFSYIDSLTGLKNRRAYDDVLNEESRNEDVGVVFCDLNSLKRINDTLGHEAGDNYIVKFTELFLESFKKGVCFRISGDEFVCIIRGINKKEMEKLIADFKDKINKNERLAAVGYVFGEDLDVLGMVKEAEKLMYKDKSAYYLETGIDRRN